VTRASSSFRDKLAPESLTIYTTYRLEHSAPGIVAERLRASNKKGNWLRAMFATCPGKRHREVPVPFLLDALNWREQEVACASVLSVSVSIISITRSTPGNAAASTSRGLSTSGIRRSRAMANSALHRR